MSALRDAGQGRAGRRAGGDGGGGNAGRLSVALHWGATALIVAQVALGLLVAGGGAPLPKPLLLGLHNTLGVVLMVLSLLRIVWNLPRSRLLYGGINPCTRILAQTVQLGLYAVLVLLPVSGWGLQNALGDPVVVFGGIALPTLVELDVATAALALRAHVLLTWALYGLVALHLAGVLFHVLVLRDGVVRRMLPARFSAPAAGRGIETIYLDIDGTNSESAL